MLQAQNPSDCTGCRTHRPHRNREDRRCSRRCIERTGYVPSTGGVEIFYRLYGEPNPAKPTIVFQHGVTGSSALFLCQLKHFCRLGYQTLAIDIRGGGLSRPSGVGPWDTETLATDLHNVTQALGIRIPFVLLGWSYGAAIAQTYYNLWPGDIIKLVIVDGTASYVSTPDFPYAIPPAVLQALIASIRANYVLAAQTAINDRIISDPCRAATTELRQKAIETALQSPEATAVGEYSAFPLFNNLANLPNIRVPTLIMWGELDPIFSLPISQYLRNHIPNSFLQYFAGKGHSPFLTDTKRFNRVLEEWLDGSLYVCDVCDEVRVV